MSIAFQIKALGMQPFSSFMAMSDEALAAAGAKWITVDSKPGYPCRVSLLEAEVGERILLVPFAYHDVPSPYQASGPIFVRELAVFAQPDVNEIPEVLQHRLLSVRAYDAQHMMVGAQVTQGESLVSVLEQHFDNDDVAYIHIHNANPGCYACSVERVE